MHFDDRMYNILNRRYSASTCGTRRSTHKFSAYAILTSLTAVAFSGLAAGATSPLLAPGLYQTWCKKEGAYPNLGVSGIRSRYAIVSYPILRDFRKIPPTKMFSEFQPSAQPPRFLEGCRMKRTSIRILTVPRNHWLMLPQSVFCYHSWRIVVVQRYSVSLDVWRPLPQNYPAIQMLWLLSILKIFQLPLSRTSKDS